MGEVPSRIEAEQAAPAPPVLPHRPPRTALQQVPTPASVRNVATGLLIGGILLLVGLLLLPWQQTAPGTGEVIAYAPADREQQVDAPVKGVIVEWLVGEGDAVAAGQPLVELRDNDPNYAARLTDRLERVREQLAAAEAKVDATELRLQAERAGLELAVAEYQQKVLEHRQKLVGEEAELDTAQRNLDRTRTLAAEGIESTRKLELAAAKFGKADATVEARRAAIAGAEQAREKARQSGAAKVAKVSEELQAARSDVASYEGKVLKLQTDQARQANQMVRAPRDGLVLRVHGGPGGSQVKEGDALVTLVPDAAQRAVALTIDGNDLPLVRPGEEVRLVLEGWPAIQFTGWPELARGTFGGRVAFVDATDNDEGGFRIVVLPDETDGKWPSDDVLRQGVRAKGWVMLGRVRLGYEIWRQLNGFPALPPKKTGKTQKPPNLKKPRKPKELDP